MPTLLESLGTNTKNHVAAQVAAIDVTPSINAELRGTRYPHLGGYGDQPFNAIDNWDFSAHYYSYQGNLYKVTANGVLAATFGLSVSEDGSEPDIEVVTDAGETISAISGNSDKLDAYGTPKRSGFRKPDLGGCQIRTIISGGNLDQSPFPVDKSLKLNRQDYIISPFIIGTSSDTTAFKKEAIQGQALFCTDTKDLYLAEITADGTTDATLSKFTPAATGQ